MTTPSEKIKITKEIKLPNKGICFIAHKIKVPANNSTITVIFNLATLEILFPTAKAIATWPKMLKTTNVKIKTGINNIPIIEIIKAKLVKGIRIKLIKPTKKTRKGFSLIFLAIVCSCLGKRIKTKTVNAKKIIKPIILKVQLKNPKVVKLIPENSKELISVISPLTLALGAKDIFPKIEIKSPPMSLLIFKSPIIATASPSICLLASTSPIIEITSPSTVPSTLTSPIIETTSPVTVKS